MNHNNETAGTSAAAADDWHRFTADQRRRANEMVAATSAAKSERERLVLQQAKIFANPELTVYIT